MRRLTFILSLTAVLAVLALSAAATASPSENSVVYWNRIAAQTILADSATATPSASSLYVAIVQAAVYDAVMAIERTYRPYAISPVAPAGASEDAAVAAAAHDVLSAYFPAQQSSIETAYTDALAGIPDGQAKTDGIDVGQEVADAIVALRANDGRFAAVPQPPDGTEPGVWRRTSPGNAVTPWTAKVTPFLIKSPDQFRAGGPPKLTSTQYADELNEVRVLGASADYPGLERTAGETAIARFWSDNTIGQYNRALRGLAQERALSVGDSARLFAMTALTGADAMIGCWDTKYHYLGWRPITAIREADTDGNPRTAGVPAWSPFSTTANHPQYVSGHACLTGAMTRSLRTFLHTKRIGFTMDSTFAGAAPPHTFATVKDLRGEVENARIYGGDHFRSGGTDGTKLGDGVAKYGLAHFFKKA